MMLSTAAPTWRMPLKTGMSTVTSGTRDLGPDLAQVPLEMPDRESCVAHLGVKARACVFGEMRRVAERAQPQLEPQRHAPVAIGHRHADQPTPWGDPILDCGQECDAIVDVLDHI